tara:strand:+ start:1719 stop:3239 length:1521 start_codon:yes stop_codon:yes gene_type:complete
MKKVIILFSLTVSLLICQDAAGNYKLTGLDVQYYSLARYDTPIIVSDTYEGMDFSTAIAQLNAGEFFFATRNGPLPEAALSAIGVNLNINLYEDGSGEIAEGSFYPDVNVDPEICVSDVEVLPITDELAYSSNGQANLSSTGLNVVGLPSIAPAQTGLGGFGLSQSVVFDVFPENPYQPTLCDAAENCFDICYGDLNEDGVSCDPYASESVPGGYPLPGVTAGYFLKEGTNIDELNSIIPGNTDPQFYLEWHSIDGPSSDSGLGDIIGEDEDGDGTDFDRIFGLPYLAATMMSPTCGFNYPIFGDVSEAFTAAGMGACVDTIDVAVDGYVMDPSGALATWGNFLTYNGLAYQQCVPTYGADTCAGLYGSDDSDHDFDGTSGRLVMHFDPTCVPQIEIREVVAEFVDLEQMNIAEEILQPSNFQLHKPYPNPFNPNSNISFTLVNSGFVKVSIFDLNGKQIDVITNDHFNSGSHEVVWNASQYPSGMYLVHLEHANKTATQKIVLIK